MCTKYISLFSNSKLHISSGTVEDKEEWKKQEGPREKRPPR